MVLWYLDMEKIDNTNFKENVERIAERLGVQQHETGMGIDYVLEGTSGSYSAFDLIHAFLDKLDKPKFVDSTGMGRMNQRFNEEIRSVLLKLPVSMIDALDDRADASGWSRSATIRQMLAKSLSDGSQ